MTPHTNARITQCQPQSIINTVFLQSNEIAMPETIMRLLINQQREIIALDRQRTQQQRPESPTVTQSGMREDTSYITPQKVHSQNKTKTKQKKPPVA